MGSRNSGLTVDSGSRGADGEEGHDEGVLQLHLEGGDEVIFGER